jgi:hypothetical protein
MISRSRHSERSEESPHFVRGRTDSNPVRKVRAPTTGASSPASGRWVAKTDDHQGAKILSELHVISLGRLNNKIPSVHQDTNAAVLAHSGITRNVEDDLILEGPAFSNAPIDPSTSRINQMRDPHPFRTYRTGPEKHDRPQSDVIVEYLEIPFLKVGNTLSGRRHNYDIETNASRSITTSSRSLLRRVRRNAKHHRRQAGKYALVDEHKLTSTQASLSNSTPGRPSCACPIHGAGSSRHEQTKHSHLGTPRLQPWASHSERNEALALGVCLLVDDELVCLNAQSNFKSMPSPFGRLSQNHLVAETVGSRHSERSEESPHFVRGRTDSNPVSKFQSPRKTQFKFQSTIDPLTPKIKWNQTKTVRRKPDCTI